MSEPTKQDQIIERIKKLMKHAESAKQLGSLQEAEAFAAKANEMLLEHNLTMHQITMSAEKDEDEFANYTYGEYINYGDNQSGNRWKFQLIKVLCKHNLCNVIFSTRSKKFKVYGLMSNVDAVVWLYNFLSIALLRIAQQSHVNLDPWVKQIENRYAYLKNFLNGAVKGFDDKMTEQLKKHTHAAAIYDLILYNSKALERYLDKVEPNKTTFRAKTIKLGLGHAEGYKAGRNLNINKPLKATSTVEGRLLGNK